MATRNPPLFLLREFSRFQMVLIGLFLLVPSLTPLLANKHSLDRLRCKSTMPRILANLQNESNRGAYSPEILRNQIGAMGLGDNADLTRLRKYGIFQEGKIVLEFGGGIGRVVDFLLQEQPQTEVIVNEHAPRSIALLEKLYKGVPRVKLFKGSILTTHDIPWKKIDTVLIMFSGLLEFSIEEQVKLFDRLFNFNASAGDIPRTRNLVIDIINPISFDFKNLPQSATMNGQDLQILIPSEKEPRKLHLYLSTPQQITSMANGAGFKEAWIDEYSVWSPDGKKEYFRISMGFTKIL